MLQFAFGLKAPALVMISCCVTGMMGSAAGGPAGAFIAAAVGAELGKMISKETKVDIIVTPALTLLSGGVVAILVGPAIGKLMNGLGSVIMTATEWQPFCIRYCYFGYSRACSYSPYFECCALYDAGAVRPGRRRSNRRLLRADGWLRHHQLP